MKIVCDSCGAKYSIADEKVQGKVFKIRCKKCSNVIVVKGTDDAAAGGDYGGAAAEWYVVIDGDQIGPIPSVEIDSYYMAGKIDAESFVWRDGLSDWVAISTLPEFAHLTQHDVAGPDEATQIAESPFGDDVDETAVASLGAGAAAGAADAFGAAPDDETINAGVGSDFGSDYGGSNDFGSDFGASNDSGYGGGDYGAGSDDYGYAAGGMDDGGYDSGDDGYSGFSADGFGSDMDSGSAGGADDGGGMFAAFDSGSEDDGGDFMSFGGSDSGAASAASGGSAGGGGGGGGIMSQNDMVGQRNENSVLFSLSSLDQVSAVSSDSGGGGGGAPMAGGGGGGGGGEVTEGSGLIDIRALASAHESMKGAGQDADDGLDPFAHGTMSMPALMPMGTHRSNKPLIIGAIVGGILFLGLVGVVIALTLGGDDKEKGGEQVIVKEIIREVAVPGESGNSAADDQKEADEAKAAAEAAEKEAEEGGAESDTEEKEDKKVASKSSSSKSSSKKSDDSAAAKLAPKTSSSSKKDDGIDGLLKKIDKKGGSDSKSDDSSKSSGGSGLKSKLSKSDVLGTIKRYQGRVHTCYTSHNSKNLSGTMKVKFYIKPSGRVTNTSVVSSKFKGSDVGGCVEKVVRGMKFPATSASSNVPVTYPFIMK